MDPYMECGRMSCDALRTGHCTPIDPPVAASRADDVIARGQITNNVKG